MRCVTPVTIKNKKRFDYQSAYMQVPCGKCISCRKAKASDWAFRIDQQAKLHHLQHFITLTYADENLPYSFNGYPQLDKTAVQKFFKRLRKHTGRKTIRYYAVGEYGDVTQRPHYHAIIFDAQEQEVLEAWHDGHVYFGDVTGGSIAYVTKYLVKEVSGPQHELDDRAPPFSLMSKKMGLNYITPQMYDWHVNHQASFVVKEGGIKQRLPRYFRDKIFTPGEKAAMNIANTKRVDEYLRIHQDAEYCRREFEYAKMAIYNDKYTLTKRVKI